MVKKIATALKKIFIVHQMHEWSIKLSCSCTCVERNVSLFKWYFVVTVDKSNVNANPAYQVLKNNIQLLQSSYFKIIFVKILTYFKNL